MEVPAGAASRPAQNGPDVTPGRSTARPSSGPWTSNIGADAPRSTLPVPSSLTRRGFLRGTALTGAGLIAAACAPGTAPAWTYPAGTQPPGAAQPTPGATTAPPSAGGVSRALGCTVNDRHARHEPRH